MFNSSGISTWQPTEEVTMIKAQSPERIKWEEAVLRAIVASGVCQSDAQSVVETGKGEVLLDSLFEAGTEPTLAAQRFID